MRHARALIHSVLRLLFETLAETVCIIPNKHNAFLKRWRRADALSWTRIFVDGVHVVSHYASIHPEKTTRQAQAGGRSVPCELEFLAVLVAPVGRNDHVLDVLAVVGVVQQRIANYEVLLQEVRNDVAGNGGLLRSDDASLQRREKEYVFTSKL